MIRLVNLVNPFKYVDKQCIVIHMIYIYIYYIYICDVGVAWTGPSFSPLLTCIHLEAALSNIDDLPVHRDPENLPEPITSWRSLDKEEVDEMIGPIRISRVMQDQVQDVNLQPLQFSRKFRFNGIAWHQGDACERRLLNASLVHKLHHGLQMATRRVSTKHQTLRMKDVWRWWSL